MRRSSPWYFENVSTMGASCARSRFSVLMRLGSASTAGSHKRFSSSAWRRTSPSSFLRGSIAASPGNGGRSDERTEISERAFSRRSLFGRPFPLDRHGQRRERDLELRVVRLDGRDFLHEKTGPKQNAQRAFGREAREQALKLEGDGGDERQER